MDGFFLAQAAVAFEPAHNDNSGAVGKAVIQIGLITQVVREDQGGVGFVNLTKLCRHVPCLNSLAVPPRTRVRLFGRVFEQWSTQRQNSEQKYDTCGACDDEQLFPGHWYLRVACQD